MTHPLDTEYHRHILHCVICFMDEFREDCDCLTPTTYRVCWGCAAEQDYKQAETLRNADY